MYKCYASALRWNKSPTKCTACGDAEKFLLGWVPPGSTPPPLVAPSRQLPQTTRPSEAAHKPTSINITIQFWLSCDAIAIMYALFVLSFLKTEKNMKIKAEVFKAKCLFEVHNRQIVALNITREILNCGTRGEKVSHSSGGCHTVVRPTSPGKFPA